MLKWKILSKTYWEEDTQTEVVKISCKIPHFSIHVLKQLQVCKQSSLPFQVGYIYFPFKHFFATLKILKYLPCKFYVRFFCLSIIIPKRIDSLLLFC